MKRKGTISRQVSQTLQLKSIKSPDTLRDPFRDPSLGLLDLPGKSEASRRFLALWGSSYCGWEDVKSAPEDRGIPDSERRIKWGVPL